MNKSLGKLTHSLFWFMQIKMTKLKDLKLNYLPKSVIKNYHLIINEKSVYEQHIDYDIKQSEEIRKLTTG